MQRKKKKKTELSEANIQKVHIKIFVYYANTFLFIRKT